MTEMNLTDHHPTDRLLDPEEIAKDTTTVLDEFGEPIEVPVPHEPTHEERNR